MVPARFKRDMVYSGTMNIPRHHYVPVFYLREWAGPDGRLQEFSRPTGGEVKARPAGPNGTGYVRGLYRFDEADEETAEAFERLFFGQVDSKAKLALDIHLGRSTDNWNGDNRSAWSKFLMGMLYRNPERIATLRKYIEDIALDNYEAGRAEYDALVPSGSPPYLDYLVKKITYDAMDWTREIMGNEKVGLHINHMRWSVRDITGCGLKLFTSDRPIMMTNGLMGDNAHLGPVDKGWQPELCRGEA
jgi:hypothetical protein